MRRLYLLAFALMVLLGGVAPRCDGAGFDRTADWGSPNRYTDNTVVAATDNMAFHLSACTAALDVATCAEIGVTAFYTLAAPISLGTWLSPQQPNTTWYYRGRWESKLWGTLSDFSDPAFPFTFTPKYFRPGYMN